MVGDELVTPALDGPIVPGIMRKLVLELAESLSLKTRERSASNLRIYRTSTRSF